MLPQVRAETVKSVGERIVSEAESQVKDVKVDKKVELGHPAKMILDFAKKGNYDLIALGSRGLSPVSRVFLGSVSDHVARQSECTVLIVR
jgi:nucleotide-binding universal stress UspA family protein